LYKRFKLHQKAQQNPPDIQKTQPRAGEMASRLCKKDCCRI